MNLKQLRDEAWDIAREVGEKDADRLWTTREMNRYINRVYRKIARETKCIRDSVTPLVCQIESTPPADLAELTLKASNSPIDALDLQRYSNPSSWLYNRLVAPMAYPLHKSIVQIDEIKWTNRAWSLRKVSVDKWRKNPYWEQVIGDPTEYATDWFTNYIAINYRSLTPDTMMLSVRRLPLVDLINDDDEPEFREHYHDFMINGILAQMYSKQDTQTYDKARYEQFEADFMRDIDEIKQSEIILEQRLNANHSLAAFR